MARNKQKPPRAPRAGSDSIGEGPRESATPSATAAAEALRTGVVPFATANRTDESNRGDDIGRALGVQEVDSGELRTTGELLDERDRKRAQQDGPDPTTRG